MTCRPSLALLIPVIAMALAGCSGGEARGPDPGDWRSMLAAGDGAGAEAGLRRALEGGASPAELAPYLGEAELQQGNLPEAQYWLTGGEFAPAVAPHGFHMLGRLRMRQGNLSAAGQAFDRALAGDPDDPELWVDVGRLRWRGGEQVQALAAAERAMREGPDNPAALRFRAQLMRDSRGNAAALPLLERGLAAAPRDRDLLAEYAATLGELGHAREMLAATRKLATVAPGDRRISYLQAVLAARAGRNDLARNLIQRSGDIDREMPAAILLLALIDMDNGNYASAAQGLDVLARRQPDNRRVRLLLARALSLGGNHRELAARFGERADEPYLALLVGRAHEALGEREKAAVFLDRAKEGGALRIEPIPAATDVVVAERRGTGEGRNVVALVRGLIVQGRPKEARARADAFLVGHPGSGDALALAGDAAFAANNPKAALDFYRRAAAVRRSWPLVQRMATAMDRTGEPARATALLAEFLAAEPANADAAAMLARRLFDAGSEAKATALVEYAKKLGRNDPVLDQLLAG